MNKRLIKILGAGGLALFMGVGTLCGVLLAPMNSAQASVGGGDAASSSNVGQGLITPHEDDPVIYTTESGLEIKFANANIVTNYPLKEGNLSGYPYFTTSNGAYVWAIIGTGDVELGLNYDTTPAGIAIRNSFGSYEYFKGTDKYYAHSKALKNPSEIEEKCVLALLTTYSQESVTWTNTNDGKRVNGFHLTNNPVRLACEGYYTNDTFGFGSYLSSVQLTTLTQRSVWRTGDYAGNYTSSILSTDLYFFPLGNGADASENLIWQTYLSPEEFGLGIAQTARSGWWKSVNTMGNCYTTATGELAQAGHAGASGCIRPACIIKV